MTHKPIHLSAHAQRQLRQTTAWYREQAGEAVALQWAEAVSDALRHVGAHPRTGSSRYAISLNLAGLRFWPVNAFPFLIFYVERETQIDVWRVLHAQRDIPAWMGDTE